MDTEIIIKSIMGLVALLAVLLFLLFLEPVPKKQHKEKKKPVAEAKEKEEPKQTIKNTDLSYLLGVLKNKQTTQETIGEVLDLIIKYHGKAPAKLGIRVHPEFSIYEDIIFTVCRHPNVNKDLVIKFDKELIELNPDYKREINEALTKGLTSRRV